MSDFEMVLICLLIPISYVLIYIAGKYDFLNLVCKIAVKNALELELSMERLKAQKPIERIIERLEEKKLDQHSAKAEYVSGMNGQSQAFCEGYIKASEEAIEIVKEEGGIE